MLIFLKYEIPKKIRDLVLFRALKWVTFEGQKNLPRIIKNILNYVITQERIKIKHKAIHDSQKC